MRIFMIIFLFSLSAVANAYYASEPHAAFSVAGFDPYEYVSARGHRVYTFYVKPDFSAAKIKLWPDRLIGDVLLCPPTSDYICIRIPPVYFRSTAKSKVWADKVEISQFLIIILPISGILSCLVKPTKTIMIKARGPNDPRFKGRPLTWLFVYSLQHGLLEFEAFDKNGKLWLQTVFSESQDGFGALKSLRKAGTQ